MSSQGPLYPGTTANLSNAGTSEDANSWTSPGNVSADDGTEASITAATYDSPDISQILVASNFGFTVPSGATIDGITVEIDRRSIIASSGKDFRVQLAKGTTFADLVGANKAATGTVWPSTTAVATYGGAADLWSATWNDTEINASSFAVFLSASANIANADIGVDFIRVTVNYTAGTLFTQSLTGGLSFVGSFAKMDKKPLAGGLSFSGTIAKSISRSLTGGLSFSGSIAKRTARSLAGGLSFLGALTQSRVILKALTGGLSFSGSLAKQTGKPLAGGLSFSGAISKRTARSLTGGLSFAGALARRTGKAMSGALSFSGSLAKGVWKSFSGSLMFVGSLSRSFVPSGTLYTKSFTATLSFSGSLVQDLVHFLLGADPLTRVTRLRFPWYRGLRPRR